MFYNIDVNAYKILFDKIIVNGKRIHLFDYKLGIRLDLIIFVKLVQVQYSYLDSK